MGSKSSLVDSKTIAAYRRHRDLIKDVDLRQLPSVRQFKFAEVYLQTRDPIYAYHEAGYFDLTKAPPRIQRVAARRVLKAQGVQFLITLAMHEWTLKHKYTVNNVANRLLKMLDQADNIKDQLAIIRELDQLSGYHNKPRRRKKSRPSPAPQMQETAAI
jgi:hypothetical protein